MLYSRAELIDLCSQAPEIESLLISIIWHLSRGDPNCQDNYGRFGLLQVRLETARAYGIQSELQLLEPKCNVQIAIQLLRDRGLLEFLGREFAAQLHSILALERYLKAHPRANESNDCVAEKTQ